MRGVDAVIEDIAQAHTRLTKLLAAGRIENDGTVVQLRQVLARAEALASAVRAKELIGKEVISVGNRNN